MSRWEPTLWWALPALIRWPIRLFCSLTGLSALWGWVSHLVGTLRGIQSLFKWLSRIWRFIVGFSSRFLKAITGSSGEGSSELLTDLMSASIQNLNDDFSASSKKSGLRLILLGPPGGGRTSLSRTLLGNSETRATMDPLMQSTERRTVVDGRELMVIDTPDVFGTSLGNNKRAKEALKSLQLTKPGPHAFLLVILAPGSSMGVNQDAFQAIQDTLELFGEEAKGYIIPVLTHADRLGPHLTMDQLLKVDAGNLKRAASLCGQRPELVDNRPDLPSEEQTVLRRRLVRRVMEIRELKGYFVHELQRREDHLREELLANMSLELARKLGHM
ncbi:GTPase IMAP family member 4-like isoform X2 [Melanotaenia boesemani]|uniref:GTPase IMAP family member 4-like isoform X2 n=1 Tax=Melanotaenia boesemani TaxID=1250792 RepID=UPI001C048AE3|nr:GTPase IMAP family member 4-like isoform X2 [Melanotaenia boesemani]XP_041829865.1 GTPase IMAP family member 4-like isoform X2 [Melanotaenia boesemani]